MEKTIIQMINEAATKLKASKLKGLKNVQTKALLEQLVRALGLDNSEQAMFFVIIFDRSCSLRCTDIDDIATYLGCSTLALLEYMPQLNPLLEKGFVKKDKDAEDLWMRRQYNIPDEVVAAIVENNELSKSLKEEREENFDKYELCKSIDQSIQDSDIDTKIMFKQVEKLEMKYADMEFIITMKGMIEDMKSRALFYEMCQDLLNRDGGGSSDINSTMKDMYDNFHDRIVEKRRIVEGTHPLMQAGLIEQKDEDTIILSDKGKEVFLGDDLKIFCKSYANLNRYEFAKAIDEYIDNDYKVDESMSVSKFIDKISLLEDANPQLQFIEKLKRFVGYEKERAVFYVACHDCSEEHDTSLTGIMQKIYPIGVRHKMVRMFKDEKHLLQTTGLIELEKKSSIFGDSISIKPTDKGKELFFEEEAELYIEKIDNKELITCDKIVERHLFFESELNNQLSLVSNSLQEEKYQQLCNRLGEKSLPHGIAVLLYGLPGTGKTESVMQIAKQTGRDIVHVDISQTKSCWFGSSEKLIKKVFENYKKACKKSKKKPILLFNEADAVFSKRKSIGSGNVDQTENAIQNIILEEMENLDGILIATTNLTENLDKAFERRFLFKIRFDKPTLEAKTNIWKDKIPALSEADAAKLASSYDFSGGEIDNIVRKVLMQEVIAGEAPTMDALQKLCSEEKIDKHNVRIGF